MITYFLTKVKGFFEINTINKGKYLDFLYVFVVFGDLYNEVWDFLLILSPHHCRGRPPGRSVNVEFMIIFGGVFFYVTFRHQQRKVTKGCRQRGKVFKIRY